MPHEVRTQAKSLEKNVKVFGYHACGYSCKEQRRSKHDRCCDFRRYLDHEKAYQFDALSSGRIIVSRGALFMKDTFISGKYEYAGSNSDVFLTQVKRPMVKTTTSVI